VAGKHRGKKVYQVIRKSGCRITGNQDIREYSVKRELRVEAEKTALYMKRKSASFKPIF